MCRYEEQFFYACGKMMGLVGFPRSQSEEIGSGSVLGDKEGKEVGATDISMAGGALRQPAQGSLGRRRNLKVLSKRAEHLLTPYLTCRRTRGSPPQ